MPSSVRHSACEMLESAIPEMQADFLASGPLRGILPSDIRADVVRVFTQVLCQAIAGGDGTELGSFVESIVWEARKLGASPQLFLFWLDRYEVRARDLLDSRQWPAVEPMFASVREHIVRLVN